MNILTFLKKVKPGPKTSIVGAILCIVSIYLFIKTEDVGLLILIMDSGLLAIGLTLLFLKDYHNRNDTGC